ncbi:MAG: phage integrase N-terminal SAM-like domain-containing protein [Sulfuricella sp.]|nr:phage integrase N-terminal SAM-like domain-containing protein [Sulfuricella sp.]
MHLKHYSIRAEQAYLDWIKRFICHFDKRHPNEMGAEPQERKNGDGARFLCGWPKELRSDSKFKPCQL